MAAPAPAVSATAKKQAELLKRDGNNYFDKKKYAAAIDAYTGAIVLCPDMPVYWTNRALCHRKLNDWMRVEEDCRRALALDHNSLKAHYMLGLVLIQKQDFCNGVKELGKALDIGRGMDPKGNVVEEVRQAIAEAKYEEWEHVSSNRSLELQRLKETCQAALQEKHARDLSQTNGQIDDDVVQSNLKQLAALDHVFAKAAEEDVHAQVPHYLSCTITLDIYRDPVITPSGVTYERAAILKHLGEGKESDPLTRKKLDASQLVPNLAIKEAVEAYLAKHGWAWQYMIN